MRLWRGIIWRKRGTNNVENRRRIQRGKRRKYCHKLHLDHNSGDT